MPSASVDRPDPQPDSRRSIACTEAALFLDLDGTLAAIEATPDAVGPDAQRTETLRRAVAMLGGRVAVVSGRSLQDVDRIVEAATPCAAGIHGLEWRGSDGDVRSPMRHPGLDEALHFLQALAGSTPGLLVEPKTLSVALHYRGAPDQEAAVSEIARRLAQSTGLVLQEGRQVVELRTPGPDKGDAVRAFMAEPPFSGARPIFVGDDLTDEHAFEAAQRLGGTGILVGPPRPTAAAGRLPDTRAVLAWIDTSLSQGKFLVELSPP